MTADAELTGAVERLPRGWSGTYLPVAESTQDVARAAAIAGAPGRSVFVADYQRAGRGRHGRAWLAPPGKALLLSILLREHARATSVASVALAEAIEAVAPSLLAEIKWPNDLMLGGRKVAGVLAEAFSAGTEQTTIVGVGVNVNTQVSDLRTASPTATSLLAESGQLVSRAVLLGVLVERLDAWLGRPTAELHAAWEARLWARGQSVRLAEGGELRSVVVLGADADGALRLRLSDGSVQRTLTGELIQ